MKSRKLCYALALSMLWPLASQAQMKLDRLDRGQNFERTQFAVLGTDHFRYYKEPLKPESLTRLLDGLASYAPTHITVELQSGIQCDLVEQHSTMYGETYNCIDGKPAQMHLGLSLADALKRIDAKLRGGNPRSDLTVSEHKELASLFLAARDPASACLQWSYLSTADQQVDAVISDSMRAFLTKQCASFDEVYQVAVPLARKLNHQRLYAVDDHTGDHLRLEDEKAYVETIKRAWAVERIPGGENFQKLHAEFRKSLDAVEIYRWVNTPENLGNDGFSAVAPSLSYRESDYPRMWVQGWDIRNMRMVANILEVAKQKHSARLLVIVGSAHKPWFEHWLMQAQTTEFVDVRKYLR